MTHEEERLARIAISRLVEPGTAAVSAAIARVGPVEVWNGLRQGLPPRPISDRLAAAAQARAEGYRPECDLEMLDRLGARVVCPGDVEWPAGRLTWSGWPRDSPPEVLFVRGVGHLATMVERSVSVVGARAASVYGVQVARDLALALAERQWPVVSGGAYGIDGAAHLGALLAERGTTVAALACGVDVAYPRGHAVLLERIAERGLLISEMPPGVAPTRSRFLVRNRVIAALSLGTVVVEAAARSGSLTTARLAGELGRVLMAVPGPVTSVMSVGSNDLLRHEAICVTSADEVIDALGSLSDEAAAAPRAPATSRDGLSALVRQVLDAVPVREWAGEATIARQAGVPALTILQVLPPLAVAGLVEQGLDGWRLTTLGAGRPARAAP